MKSRVSDVPKRAGSRPGPTDLCLSRGFEQYEYVACILTLGGSGPPNTAPWSPPGLVRWIPVSRQPIISRAQALQILKNDLRRVALEEHAAELNNATPERRAEVVAQIDRDVQRELRERSMRIDPDSLLH
jgi:hypothetical protein